MSQIAGLQDFRQQAPPADTGIFQLPVSIMVFQYTFAGTNYFCALRSGERGWVLVDYGTVAATVIQSAITELTNGGSILIAGAAANYVINATLTDAGNSDITLIIDSGATLQAANGLNAALIAISNEARWLICGGGIIDGNKANNASGSGISFDTVTNSQISDLTVQNFQDDNIIIDTSGVITVENVYSYNSNRDGISLPSSYDVQIIACQVMSVGRYGLVGNASYRVSVVGGNYTDNHDDNIHFLNGAYNITVVAATCQGSDVGVGILYAAVLDSSIVACECIDNGLQGITFQLETFRSTIIGSTCRHNSLEGIQVMSSSLNTITGNTCHDNNQSETADTAGIGVGDAGGSASEYNIISSNYVGTSDGDETAGIRLFLQSAGNIVIGNTVEYVTGAEIHLDLTAGTGTRNAVVGNIVFGGNEEALIKLEGADNCLVSGNLTAGGWSGIQLEGSDKCLVVGNTCTNADQYNIIIDNNSDDNTVFANRTEGGGVGECQVANANCDVNVILGNDFAGVAVADAGTGTVITRANWDNL